MLTLPVFGPFLLMEVLPFSPFALEMDTQDTIFLWCVITHDLKGGITLMKFVKQS